MESVSPDSVDLSPRRDHVVRILPTERLGGKWYAIINNLRIDYSRFFLRTMRATAKPAP